MNRTRGRSIRAKTLETDYGSYDAGEFKMNQRQGRLSVRADQTTITVRMMLNRSRFEEGGR